MMGAGVWGRERQKGGTEAKNFGERGKETDAPKGRVGQESEEGRGRREGWRRDSRRGEQGRGGPCLPSAPLGSGGLSGSCRTKALVISQP